MNHRQGLALQIAFANLALLLLFPPYDYVSLQLGNTPTFEGFSFLLADHANGVVNRGFLQLEIIVLCINAAIAWLLLGSQIESRRPGANGSQRAVLWLVAINLTLMMLFPPFEYYYAISAHLLPTFDGFYLVFGDNSRRQIVTPVLYIEAALVLINGGLLWILFEERAGGPRRRAVRQ
jgi:hypothetical protein